MGRNGIRQSPKDACTRVKINMEVCLLFPVLTKAFQPACSRAAIRTAQKTRAVMELTHKELASLYGLPFKK
jgi:hypothetical protein